MIANIIYECRLAIITTMDADFAVESARQMSPLDAPCIIDPGPFFPNRIDPFCPETAFTIDQVAPLGA
jgi:hypothetical protein